MLAEEQGWQERRWSDLARRPPADWPALGFGWPPMKVVSADPGRRTLVRLQAKVPLHDGIGAGDPVWLDPDRATGKGFAGTVLWAEGRLAEVLVDDDPPEGWERRPAVTVIQRFDPTTFQRYRAGLKRAALAPGPVGDALLGGDLAEPAPIPDPPGFSRLDPSQRDAGRRALAAKELAVVHGPPGTGKTRLIGELLRAMVDAGERPWALADSNAAADLLAIRAGEMGLRVIRLGHPARVGAGAQPYTLDAVLDRGPLADALRRIDKEIRKAKGWQDRKKLFSERDALSDRARAHALGEAQVIAATLATAAREAPRLPEPGTAVVDEATQAIEPAIWSVVPWIKRLILVGDPHQLGPVVLQPGNPLGRSLLERLVGSGHAPMLEIQYRMNLGIQQLVQPVYGPAYRPGHVGGLLSERPGVAVAELTSVDVLWVDTAGSDAAEVRDPLTGSLYEPVEIGVVRTAVRLLREAGVPADDIGVITPYSAQRQRILEAPELAGVEVATVNAFQGREKLAMVVSFVRSNADGELGFVADRRRLVVALTRAKRLLVCTGDTATLGGNADFAGVLADLEARGAIRTVWEEPWAPPS